MRAAEEMTTLLTVAVLGFGGGSRGCGVEAARKDRGTPACMACARAADCPARRNPDGGTPALG